jgi:hypothetical protein
MASMNRRVSAVVAVVGVIAAALAGLVIWGLVNRWMYAGGEGYADGVPVQTLFGGIALVVIASVAVPLRWLIRREHRAAMTIGLILWFVAVPVALSLFGISLLVYSSANS